MTLYFNSIGIGNIQKQKCLTFEQPYIAVYSIVLILCLFHDRYQKRNAKAASSLLYGYWDQYRQGALSAEQLAAKAGNLKFNVKYNATEIIDC